MKARFLRLALLCLVLPGTMGSARGRPAGLSGPAGSATAAIDPAGVPAAPDTLRLGALQRSVESADPRFRRLEMEEEITDLRLRNLSAEWLPRLTLRADASYQTEVPRVRLGDPDSGAAGAPGTRPGLDFSVPEPPKDRYEVAAELEQLVHDGGRRGRRKRVERARLAERTAETRTALFGLREEVNSAFFAALLEQERRARLALLADDLEARRDLVAARVREGAALPSQLAAVEAEAIRVRQDLASAEAARLTALARLELLLGQDVDAGDLLAVPDLETEAEAALRRLTGASQPFASRPEWRRFARTDERLRAEAELADAGDHPRVTTFLRGAYARPGLDFFDDTFSPHAMLGVRVRWPALDWGSSEREASAVRLRARAIQAERDAFAAGLRRRVAAAVNDVERLEDALAMDDRAVSLREGVERTARRQLEEGTLLPADYVEKRTELFEARLRRRTHRVRLAEARARLLTTMGLDVPEAPGAAEPVVPVSPPMRPLPPESTREPDTDRP